MFFFMASKPLAWLSVFYLSSLQLVLGQSPRCGSLITYRQHSVLLSEAPQCFRKGCDSGNTSSIATTISSPCPIAAPCNELWDIIRGKFEQDWCESCHRDIACRIGGWPILNMTEACNVSPGDWIFSGNNSCCSSGDEPFQIANWIQTLCNGSEWRAPFTYYGGMAKEDWEEWIEAWNWTLRPQNTSSHNVTTQPNCSSSAFLWTWGMDDISKVAYFILSVLATILFEIIHPRKPGFHWLRAVGGGVFDFLATLLGGIGATYIVKNTPGYETTPVGELILLISSRPSVFGFLSSILILIIVWEDGRYYQRNRYISLAGAHAATGLAICEALQYVVGAAYLTRTADVGRKRISIILDIWYVQLKPTSITRTS